MILKIKQANKYRQKRGRIILFLERADFILSMCADPFTDGKQNLKNLIEFHISIRRNFLLVEKFPILKGEERGMYCMYCIFNQKFKNNLKLFIYSVT